MSVEQKKLLCRECGGEIVGKGRVLCSSHECLLRSKSKSRAKSRHENDVILEDLKFAVNEVYDKVMSLLAQYEQEDAQESVCC